MKLQNVAISLVFVIILYLIYSQRGTMDMLAFEVLIFGALIAGGLYLWKEVLNKEHVKHDERTELLAGKAARLTLIAAFVLIILILAFLSITGRPTSPIGVLAMLAGLLGLTYSGTYAYLEKR
ncbi:DUF2178 domain-containing protein [Candidatus Micrarchaeota archaeon]|nr:DUF2178 domain-containing protein [Candidatus Micrarchaeota archaeon]